KAAIACRRFRGRHTYDAIATELEDIFSQYGLTNDKVTACVTDNGSNFVKAFKEHQQRQVESNEEEDEVDGD
ncbi:Calfumirin-1, partial [Dissostichus eleginoides]